MKIYLLCYTECVTNSVAVENQTKPACVKISKFIRISLQRKTQTRIRFLIHLLKKINPNTIATQNSNTYEFLKTKEKSNGILQSISILSAFYHYLIGEQADGL